MTNTKGIWIELENDKPIKKGYYLNLVDILSENSEFSKSEIRRRIKSGAVQLYEDKETVAINSQYLFTRLPITVKYGKRNWIKVTGGR